MTYHDAHHRRGLGRVIALAVNFALIGVAVWLYFHRDIVLDQIALVNYSPPSEVVSLATDDTMTDLAKRYLYASHPTIDDRTTFNANCKNNDEQTIVLGCYSARQIHVFDITDARLNGVKQVTLAHETLHAAYARLSDGERSHVNALIEQQIQQTGPKDQHIQQLIDIYGRTEPGELDNEMHSILGSEVSNLSPELEKYYKQYFTDRTKIATYAQQYQSVFTTLKNQQTDLVNDLNALAETINSRTTILNNEVVRLNNDITNFNQQANSGQFSSSAAFNEARAPLVSRQQQLAAERAAIQQLIGQYNTKRQQLESLNLEAESLNTSINSTLAPVPTVK